MRKKHHKPPNPKSLIRPSIRRLHAYVPGEQPKIPGLIKLNTNENPYPPALEVLAAIGKSLDGRLRLYPNPSSHGLRAKLARRHRCAIGNIIIGNGSDELLALATRAFAEPAGTSFRRNAGPPSSWHLVQYFTPSYSLYPVLADIHGAVRNPVPLSADFRLPTLPDLRKEKVWNFRAGLSFITTPNAPSGRAYSTRELEQLCRAQEGVIILDEAYVDFARENALALALQLPNVLVSRTFSKAYSLCFQRIGYFVGHPDLISALDRIRDSYNVNGLGQIAAEATLDCLPYYRANFRRIISTRRRLSRELGKLGFRVLPSQANFILARPPVLTAGEWLEALRQRRILVRWFPHPEVRDFIRITIGTDAEMDTLLAAVKDILEHPPK